MEQRSQILKQMHLTKNEMEREVDVTLPFYVTQIGADFYFLIRSLDEFQRDITN